MWEPPGSHICFYMPSPYGEREKCYSRGYAIARCQAKTTLKSYWHELRDHQEYCKKLP